MAVGAGLGSGAVWVDVEFRFPDLGKAMRGVGNAFKSVGQGAGQAVAAAIKASGQASAASIKAQGNAAAASIRAQGAAAAAAVKAANPAQQAANAFATRMRAAATAQAQVIRANAAAHAQVTRAQGVANAQFAVASSRIRATGSALSTAAQGFGYGIRSALQGTASLVSSITSPLRAVFGGGGMMGSLFGGGGMLGAFLGGAGGGVVGGAIQQAMGMETAMVRLGRVTGLPAGQLKGLTDEIKDMSTVIPVGVEELFRIVTMSAKMGIAGRDLGMFTREIARMSVIFGEDKLPIEEATNMMARLINVFHLGHDQIRGVASVLNALDIASTASARDILEMTTRMSGLASVMKLTLPQAMTLATAMRESGIEVGVGGTAMSQLLARMAGSRDAGFARIAGMRPDAFRRMVDTKPMEALTKFFGGLQRMSPRAGIQALEQLQMRGRLTAGTYEQLARVFDRVSRYGKIADEEFVTGASIQKGFSAVAGTTAKQLELLWNNLKLSAIEIGQHLLPIVRGLSGGLGDLFKDIRAYLEDNQDTLRGWGEWIGRTVSNVGVLWRQFPLFVEYGSVLFEEKLDQIKEVAWRFSMGLWANFKWAFAVPGGELWKLLFNFGKGIAAFLGDLFTQVGDNLRVQIQNAIRMATNPFANPLPVPPIRPQVAHLVAPFIANPPKAPPGFGGLFGNLPDRGAALGDIRARIQGAHAAQMQENEERRARMDEADFQTRLDAQIDRAAARENRALMLRAFGGRRGPGGATGRALQINRQERQARDAFNRQERMERDAYNRMFFGGDQVGGTKRAVDNDQKQTDFLEDIKIALQKMVHQGIPAVYDA